ncbi:MAG TPA: hypothetical protein DCO72_04440 [Ruminococcus sp.]|nr:hypothetical protein [Ruminococcus sp.]
MLEDKMAYYQQTKKKLNNTPAQYKEAFPFLKDVDSMALCNAQMNLQNAYNNFFTRPNNGFPKFKSRRNSRKSYTTNCINGNVTLENGFLKLPKTKGLVKINQHRKIPDKRSFTANIVTSLTSTKRQ